MHLVMLIKSESAKNILITGYFTFESLGTLKFVRELTDKFF